MVSNQEYQILSSGNSSFTSVGSSSNSAGTIFRYDGGSISGTGTIQQLGFEVSHTSIDTKIHGIIHTEDRGLHIINPTFFSGGTVSGGTSTLSSVTTSNAGDAGQSITVTAYGGGGAGGYGLANGYATGTYNSSGGSTVVEVWAGVPNAGGSTLLDTITAGGGAGGENAVLGYPWRGSVGAASEFGAGGSSGFPNSAGGASPNFSAGGGGAGGDQESFFDSSGGCGRGGSIGVQVARTIDTSSYVGTKQIHIKLTTLGAGGVSSGGSYAGGTGGSGAVTYSSILGGMTQYELEDIATIKSGTVGSYATAMYQGTVVFGSTYAGSTLLVASTANTVAQSTGGESFSGGAVGSLSGTWRAMCRGTAVANRFPTGNFARIS